MTTIEAKIGPDSLVSKALQEEKGHILSFHNIQASAMLAAVQISTSYLSLRIIGYLGTVLLTAFFCRYFWTQVVSHFLGYIVAYTIVLCINLAMWAASGTTLRRNNKEVARPGWWLFVQTVLTAHNMVVGVLLAVFRIALLLVLSILDISRVDRSMLPYWRSLDNGYVGFYGMLLLQEGFGRYFKTSREDQEYLLR